MDTKNMTDRQLEIVGNLQASGFPDSVIEYELPAIERIVDDLEGIEPQRYTRRTPPTTQSFLGKIGATPNRANSLLDNLSQRVQYELNESGEVGIHKQRPVDIAKAIAIGAQSIKENENIWRGLGLLDNFYNSGSSASDVIEGRYAAAANMLANYMRTHPMLPFDMMSGDPNKPKCGLCPNFTKDYSEFIELFREWMNTLEPYMQIISKEIDRTIGAPTQRIKHLKVYDPEGDRADITELDLSRFSQITPDSLAMLGVSNTMFALKLDELTMTEQYFNETKKYIDVFVVDQSGSMGGTKILRAAAFLFNRLDKVIKGWAMCAIIEFDTSARVYELPFDVAAGKPRWMIDTPAKAKWAQQNIIKKYAKFVGGGTDIPAGVNKGIELSLEMEKHGGILPNITVITDDDTSIAAMDAAAIKVPVNGLALRFNHPLQEFVVKTGGEYNNLEQIDLSMIGGNASIDD